MNNYNQQFTVATFNGRGLRDRANQLALEQALLLYTIDICLIQESKWYVLPTAFKHYKVFIDKFDDNRQGADMAFLVRNEISSECKVFEHDSVGFALEFRRWIVINVHGANESKPTYWKQTEKWIFPADREIILGGDFNLCLREIDRTPAVTDAHQLELRKCLTKFELYDVFATLHPNETQFTHTVLENGLIKSRSRIDRFYVTEGTLGSCRAVATTPVLGSDHDMVVLTYREGESKGKKTTKKSLGVQVMQVPAVRTNIRKVISECKNWEQIHSKMQSQMGKFNRLGDMKFRSRLKSLITRLKKAKDRKQTEKIETLEEALKTHILTTQSLSVQTRSILETKMGVQYLYHADMKKFMKPQVATFIKELTDTDGVKKTDEESKAKIACKFYKELYAKCSTSDSDRFNALVALKEQISKVVLIREEQTKFDNLMTPIDETELSAALKDMKSGKSPGPDGLPYEFFKNFKVELMPHLLTYFNEILLGKPMKESKDAIIAILFKKNDKTLMKNYRPITLNNTVYKLFAKVMAKRLTSALGPLFSKDQHAFLEGRSIFDPIYNIQTTIDAVEKSHVWDEAALIFLDQEKAYDRVDQEFMFECLKVFKVPDKLIEVIRRLYVGCKARVRLNGTLSDPLAIEQGVKQGDPLSCIIFICVMESLGALLRSNPELGIELEEVKKTLDMYVDDTTIYLKSIGKWNDLKETLNIYERGSNAKFNAEKTEALILGRQSVPPAEIAPYVRRQGSIRHLGCPVGTNFDVGNHWQTLLDKTLQSANYFGTISPNFRDRIEIARSWIYSKIHFTLNCLHTKAVGIAALDTFSAQVNKKVIFRGSRVWVSQEVMARPKIAGGFNLPRLKDLRYNIMVNMVKKWDQNRGKEPFYQLLLTKLWHIAALTTTRSPILMLKIDEKRLKQICWNPWLQQIKEIGSLQKYWPPLFHEMLSLWYSLDPHIPEKMDDELVGPKLGLWIPKSRKRTHEEISAQTEEEDGFIRFDEEAPMPFVVHDRNLDDTDRNPRTILKFVGKTTNLPLAFSVFLPTGKGRQNENINKVFSKGNVLTWGDLHKFKGLLQRPRAKTDYAGLGAIDNLTKNLPIYRNANENRGRQDQTNSLRDIEIYIDPRLDHRDKREINTMNPFDILCKPTQRIAFALTSEEKLEYVDWVRFWKQRLQPHIQVFLYQATTRRLLLGEQLGAELQHNYDIVNCKLCGDHYETYKHLFSECVWAEELGRIVVNLFEKGFNERRTLWPPTVAIGRQKLCKREWDDAWLMLYAHFLFSIYNERSRLARGLEKLSVKQSATNLVREVRKQLHRLKRADLIHNDIYSKFDGSLPTVILDESLVEMMGEKRLEEANIQGSDMLNEYQRAEQAFITNASEARL